MCVRTGSDGGGYRTFGPGWLSRRPGAVCCGASALDSNTARHAPLNCGVFCRKQATMRLTSGTCSPQSRQTSGVQASCCAKVPRYSSVKAALCRAKEPAIAIATPSIIRCARISDSPLLDSVSALSAGKAALPQAPEEMRHGKVRRAQQIVKNPRAGSMVARLRAATGKCSLYSTLPIFLTAATRRALSVSTNFANSGASI
jgi:hypothetical protein